MTKQDIRRRWSSHVYDSKQPACKTAIGRAMRRHGHQNFRYFIIETADSLERAADLEIFLINELRTQRPSGYNITLGGEGVWGFSNPLSDQTKQKIRKAHLGKKHSPEHIANSAAAHRGLKHSAETRRRLSEMRKGQPKPKSEAHRRALSASHRGKKRGPQSAAHIEARRQGILRYYLRRKMGTTTTTPG